MTNEQIIFNAACELMNSGAIKGTGRFLEGVDAAGNQIRQEIPEAIHTFQCWKNLGYSVRKGEKAVTKLSIWKCVIKAGKEASEDASEATKVIMAEPNQKMFMKVSAFFAAHQVEPTRARA